MTSVLDDENIRLLKSKLRRQGEIGTIIAMMILSAAQLIFTIKFYLKTIEIETEIVRGRVCVSDLCYKTIPDTFKMGK